MKKLTATKIAAALLLSAAPAALADPVFALPAPAIPVANPLAFYDGKIVFDFEERLRWEIRQDNYDFADSNKAVTDDNWFEQRLRLGMLIAPCQWFRVYGQLEDSREFNSDRRNVPGLNGAEGDDTFELHQAWVELGNIDDFPLLLRVGRQILSYGDERLVGGFDWNNIARTYDAARLRWQQDTWWVDAFASSVVNPDRGYDQSDFFNGTENSRHQIFSGIYFESVGLIPWQATDVYLFHLHENDNPRYSQNTLGDSNFFTFGFRFKSKPGAFAPKEAVPADYSKDAKTVKEPKDAKDAKGMAYIQRPIGLDYTVEVAGQAGQVRGQDLTAYAVHGDVGYTFDSAMLPRLAISYSHGSGDQDPNDKDIQTFQNLFPTNHKFYGQMDLFSWQNMHDIELDTKIQPLRNVCVRVDYHAFFLATNDDAWYRANGTTIVRPLTAAAQRQGNFVGQELDFLVTWNVNPHLQFEGGYSRFFHGDYLAATGPNDDADFGYLQAKLTF